MSAISSSRLISVKILDRLGLFVIGSIWNKAINVGLANALPAATNSRLLKEEQANDKTGRSVEKTTYYWLPSLYLYIYILPLDVPEINLVLSAVKHMEII